MRQLGCHWLQSKPPMLVRYTCNPNADPNHRPKRLCGVVERVRVPCVVERVRVPYVVRGVCVCMCVCVCV